MPHAIKNHKPKAVPVKYRTLKDRQGTRTLALNGAAWRKLRARVLAEQPMCADCYSAGRMTLATDVDHADNDPANNELSNLVGLCHACHSAKTRRWMNENRQQPTDANRAPRLAHATAVESAQKIGRQS